MTRTELPSNSAEGSDRPLLRWQGSPRLRYRDRCYRYVPSFLTAPCLRGSVVSYPRL